MAAEGPAFARCCRQLPANATKSTSAIAMARRVYCRRLEHIEGCASGDSSCVLPAVSLSPAVLNTIRDYTKRLALALKVVGLMNVQYAIQRETVYVLEVNPRASRTIPYVSKATGVPLAKVAARLVVGKRLADMKLPLVHHNGVA